MLKEKISEDIKNAMRGKEIEKLSALRMLLSAIKDREIFLRKGEDVVLNDEQIVEVIMGEVKKRKDSVAAYEQGGRNDLAEKEKKEIKMLDEYLPEQMSDEELEKIIKEIIETIQGASMKDFGKIMAAVMPKVKGKVDGNRISGIVKKILAGN